VYSGIFASLNTFSWPHPGTEGRKLEESLGKMESHAYTQRVMPSHTQIRNEAQKQNDPYRLASVMEKG